MCRAEKNNNNNNNNIYSTRWPSFSFFHQHQLNGSGGNQSLGDFRFSSLPILLPLFLYYTLSHPLFSLLLLPLYFFPLFFFFFLLHHSLNRLPSVGSIDGESAHCCRMATFSSPPSCCQTVGEKERSEDERKERVFFGCSLCTVQTHLWYTLIDLLPLQPLQLLLLLVRLLW